MMIVGPVMPMPVRMPVRVHASMHTPHRLQQPEVILPGHAQTNELMQQQPLLRNSEALRPWRYQRAKADMHLRPGFGRALAIA